MTTTINASTSTGLSMTADGSGVVKLQSNGVTTNALAWVNFNGTTSPGTIRASYNVSSVTRNSTGNYTINFANALSDANYTILGSTIGNTSSYTWVVTAVSAPSTSSIAIQTGRFDTTTGVLSNNDYVSVVIFGN